MSTFALWFFFVVTAVSLVLAITLFVTLALGGKAMPSDGPSEAKGRS